jgi:hypothetical protein
MAKALFKESCQHRGIVCEKRKLLDKERSWQGRTTGPHNALSDKSRQQALLFAPATGSDRFKTSHGPRPGTHPSGHRSIH